MLKLFSHWQPGSLYTIRKYKILKEMLKIKKPSEKPQNSTNGGQNF